MDCGVVESDERMVDFWAIEHEFIWTQFLLALRTVLFQTASPISSDRPVMRD